MNKTMMDKMIEAHRIALALSRTLSRETKDPPAAIRASCMLFVSTCLSVDWNMDEDKMIELVQVSARMARSGYEESDTEANLQ